MTTKKHTTVICLVLIVLLLGVFSFLYNRKNIPQESISATSFKLNTVITIKIYDSSDEKILDEALSLCDKYENLFSRTKKSSEIYALNHKKLPRKNDAFIVSSETAELISKGLSYGTLSDGAFDIAIEPVSSLWDFTSEEKRIPSQNKLDAALPFVNYKDVLVNENTIQFKQKNMGLDLGAIAKGYIADKIKEFLLSKGVKSATINLGGNVLCVGNRPDGTPFRIGIQKPFADRSETIATMEISDKSVVSSGIYERFFEKDGRLYHHILNPADGYPYQNNLISVTIISDKSVDGDGLSTSCFALGLEKGMKLINSLPDVHAVFITDDYTLHYSNGFKSTIPLTEITD